MITTSSSMSCGSERHEPLWRLATLFCIAALILAGCGKSNTGVFAQSDYSYRTDTPQELSGVRSRFDRAVKFVESAGLRSEPVERPREGGEAILRGKGMDVRFTLSSHDNGFTTIALSFSYEGTGTETKAQAESLLTGVQSILDPAVASSEGK
jgi:hypothetical protein